MKHCFTSKLNVTKVILLCVNLKMRFIEFAQLLSQVEEEPSRNRVMELLAEFFKKLKDEEVQPVLSMIIGRVVPSYIPVEFNFSTKLIQKSLLSKGSFSADVVQRLLAEKGDIGSVAETLSSKLEVHDYPYTTIKKVHAELYELAVIGGKGSQEIKQNLYFDLFKKMDPLSIRYVTRIITGKLRLGTSHKTILDAISWTVVGDKGLRSLLDRAYGVRSDLGIIAEYALKGEINKLEQLKIEVGIPVASKLVEREKSAEAAFNRLGECVVQPKYDGLRTQIHYKKSGFIETGKKILGTNISFELGGGVGDVRIFSRNMESLTEMFPDIVKAVRMLNVDSIVLDSESIGYDKDKDKFISFQETMTRKRKYGILEKSVEFPIKVFVFDILFLNGKDLSRLSLADRLEALAQVFGGGTVVSGGFENKEFDKIASNQDVMTMAGSQIVRTEVELNDVFRNTLARGLEGVIVKDLKGEYTPGTRNYDWIKLKANTYEDLVDSVDCVVLGYYYGRGIRAKYGVGAFLVGVYDEKVQKFQTIAKVGSGVKDNEWEHFLQDISQFQTTSVPDNVEIDKDMMPDVVCEPKIVAVIDADEVSKSRKHTAGRDQGVGFSLRFPRMKIWGRVDKNPEQVTTVEEIRRLYEIQNSKA